eukprot:TRINITY_DN26193_c0_g1_i1.p1 TRINITY_DN26193_c0_g1~~TRINITY_DN26193_c0_g1_i1.p1  ORF type:complete len:290 (-),score=59.60 TRINITY_DN26193_c0_g1_i1:78-947(-)
MAVVDGWQAINVANLCCFTFFTAAFGPLIARPVLHVIEWEIHSHRVRLSHQMNDFYKGLPYSLALYAFGNYDLTFNWIIALVLVCTLFIYARIAEISFLKVSLHSKWSWKAWIVMTVGFSAILLLAVYHFYLAWLTKILWPWYVLAVVVAIIMAFVLPFLVHHLDVNLHVDYLLHRCLRRFLCCWHEKARQFNAEKDAPQMVYSFDPDEAVNVPQDQRNSSSSTSPRLPASPPGPEKLGISVHIHHWQLFILFAFFTRFQDLVSNICAGIVLGIYVQGIAAYGFDEVLC